MFVRTVYTALTVCLCLSACSESPPGGDPENSSSEASTEGVEETTNETGSSSSSSGDGESGDGDGESGDGDGESGDGDGNGESGDGDGDGESGDGDGDADSNPLDDIPPEEWEPTGQSDGIPFPGGIVYTDKGPADPSAGFRSLISFRIRQEATLHNRIQDMYTPQAPSYRQYMTPAEWIEDHAPELDSVELITAYLEAEGFSVNFISTNRLFLQFTGTVGQFNQSFGTTLHVCDRINPQAGNPPIEVYCASEGLELPLFVTQLTRGITTADLPAETGQMPVENIPDTTGPNNPNNAFFPHQLMQAYGGQALMDMGYDGTGQHIGVVAGAHFHRLNLLKFWEIAGIGRDEPAVVHLMEEPVTRYIETHLDTSWSGAMAPGAALTVYEAPDSRNTSMIYGFNEAIALGQVDIITDSFAHREDSEPLLVRLAYDDAGSMAAALGITVLVASGDSARPDTPSTSAFVTGVGGTRLTLDNQDQIVNEVAWSGSGSGIADSIDLPWWQQGVVTDSNGKRALCDISLAASPSSPYWVFYLGNWSAYGGTSFSAPTMAGLMALVNERRLENGLPRAGFINPAIYTNADVQAAFRDVTTGSTDIFDTELGWDYPTGWGSPHAALLADALP